jgi:hypothetical protein
MAFYRRRARTTSQLRDQLIRQLEKEGEKLLKSLMSDFTRDLNGQMETSLKQLTQGLAGSGTAGNFNWENTATSLFSTASAYLFSRPRTSTSSRESSRSQQFRVSTNQAAAEMAQRLSRGEKNS